MNVALRKTMTREQFFTWAQAGLAEGDTLVLPEVGIEIPLADFYEGVTLDEPAAGQT